MDAVFIAFIAALLGLGMAVGVITNRLWSPLVAVVLVIAVWVGAGNDGDGEIPGWILGLVVGGPVGLGALVGVLMRRTDWTRS